MLAKARYKLLATTAGILSLAVSAGSVDAAPSLRELQDIDPGVALQEKLATQRTMASLREAAISYGSRGGLAYQAELIRAKTERLADEFDMLYEFESLMYAGPSNLLILPPVISQIEGNLAISNEGNTASLAAAEYRVVKQGRIVSQSPDWRSYLYRTYPDPEKPSMLLRPKTKTERTKWKEWVAEGWAAGIEHANLTYELDHARLLRDIQGIGLYRILLKEGKANQLHLEVHDQEVLVDGSMMRVGDRVVNIVQQSTFNGDIEAWTPVILGRESMRPIGRRK